MHIEFLIEDSSGGKALDSIVPKILGDNGANHTWRIHSYKGIGKLPTDLGTRADPAKRILLQRLPQILNGYSKTHGIDAIVIVVDSDKRNANEFLNELREIANAFNSPNHILVNLATEEIEAWYLGDSRAIRTAYPQAKGSVLDSYIQDSACNTWELLADAVYPGGYKKIKKLGWPAPGQLKHEWAEKIAPLLNIEENRSPSFCCFRDDLKRVTS